MSKAIWYGNPRKACDCDAPIVMALLESEMRTTADGHVIIDQTMAPVCEKCGTRCVRDVTEWGDE